MRKLSAIKENVLTDIIDRSRTGVSRKEDILHPSNIYELTDIIKSEYEKQGKNLDLRHIDVSNIKDISFLFCIFDNNIETIDVTGWNTSNITEMCGVFYCCKHLKKIKGIENWDVSKVTNMAYMFDNCLSLEHLDLSGWDTSSVKDMEHMFSSCKSLKDIKGIENWNIKKVKNKEDMFSYCGVSYKLKKNMLIKENVLTDIIDRSRTGSFRKEDKLHPANRDELKLIIESEHEKQRKNLDLRHIDVSNIDDFSYIFYHFNDIETIDVTGWDTRNIKRMNNVFRFCESLKEIKGIENWDVRNVKDMNYMFGDCPSLEYLDLSGWNTSSVEDMYCMFSDCNRLKDIKGIENWNVSNVTNMDMTYMFDGCGVSYKLKDNMLIKENVLTDIIDRSRTGDLKKEDYEEFEYSNTMIDKVVVSAKYRGVKYVIKDIGIYPVCYIECEKGENMGSITWFWDQDHHRRSLFMRKPDTFMLNLGFEGYTYKISYDEAHDMNGRYFHSDSDSVKRHTVKELIADCKTVIDKMKDKETK